MRLALATVGIALAACTSETRAEPDTLSQFQTVCLASDASRERIQSIAREQGWRPLVLGGETPVEPEWEAGYHLPDGGRLIISGVSRSTVTTNAPLPGGATGNAYREAQMSCGVAWSTSEDPTNDVEAIATSLSLQPFRFGPTPTGETPSPQMQVWGRPDRRLITSSYNSASGFAVVETIIQLPADDPIAE